MNAPLPRRRDEARALFRNAILDAAEAVFAVKGFHGARLQDIAAGARIAVGTVYNHFEDKDAVLAALLEERSEAMLVQLRPARQDRGSFTARLEARLARVLAYVQEHRAFFAIANEHGVFAGTAAPGAGAARKRLRRVERFRAAFRAIVQEGIASGELEPLEADTLVRFLGGTLRAFVLSTIDARHPVASDDAATIVALFLHGAARRRPRTRTARRSRGARAIRCAP
ncbi:MAG: TetR/AcrR family transcriptional regulator [Polyangiaceae bacterium]